MLLFAGPGSLHCSPCAGRFLVSLMAVLSLKSFVLGNVEMLVVK